MIVVFLGSVLSLIPRLKQKNEPNSDLLVPVMQVSTNLPKYIRYLLFFIWILSDDTLQQLIYFHFNIHRMFYAVTYLVGQGSLWRKFGAHNKIRTFRSQRLVKFETSIKSVMLHFRSLKSRSWYKCRIEVVR